MKRNVIKFDGSEAEFRRIYGVLQAAGATSIYDAEHQVQVINLYAEDGIDFNYIGLDENDEISAFPFVATGKLFETEEELVKFVKEKK